ncbi:hypothetical protein M758_1G272000 [Ceratodon purpureus]|uniref:C2 domain-containing protein n=1 Tax=Ceratodon purpureus TaxID=3225 RepID=A0A8T0JCL4_CERPU|nr:hypothetical protein KC19_1G280000 [Ceratodon purpureus]KAG0631680.1 hypothetical protein M758_1G272000 [Ceratodon purpureus]
MATTYREIELNIFSANDLRDVRYFGGKMSPYVVAWVHHDLKAYSPADVKGSTDPSWHTKLLVYCNEDALHHPDEAVIYFELHDAASTSDRLIGALSYPLSELPGHIASSKEPSEPVFLNLPVKRPSGREQGVLNISLKMGGVTQQPISSEDPHHVHHVQHGDGAMAPDDESFLAGCCGLPHFPRDEQVGSNVTAH